MELLSALGKGPTRVLGYALGVWAGTWGVYYLLQETRRYWALRARQRKHPLRIRDGESDAEWFGQADDAERGRITSRFATLRFCGRYLNVTPEWREQGLWEWMWWKVVHTTFFHGRFGWDGGFSRDEKTEEGRKRIESLLPVEPLDTQRLWGTGSEPAAPSSGISYTWCVGETDAQDRAEYLPDSAARPFDFDGPRVWQAAARERAEPDAHAADAVHHP